MNEDRQSPDDQAPDAGGMVYVEDGLDMTEEERIDEDEAEQAVRQA